MKNQESHYTTHNDTQFLCSKPHFEKNLLSYINSLSLLFQNLDKNPLAPPQPPPPPTIH